MSKIAAILGTCLTGIAIAYVTSSSAWSNEAHDRLMRLSDSQRNAMFTKLLNASGETCQVTKNFYQGSTKDGAAFWNVACKGKDGFTIAVYNDATGSTKILECRIMKLVGATPCFKKF